MLRFLFEHYPALACLALGLLLVVWPPPEQATEERARQTRLDELAAGAEERHFEERRELEAYGPDSAGPFRFWGFLLLLLSLAILFL